MTHAMPRVDTAKLGESLSGHDFRIAMMAVTTRKGVTRLRATKPDHRKDREHGIAAYAWRMAAFLVSPRHPHNCMPVCATFYIRGTYSSDERKADMAVGERVYDAIVDAVDKRDWHGVIRWGFAMGKLGTPRYNAEGAVIYR